MPRVKPARKARAAAAQQQGAAGPARRPTLRQLRTRLLRLADAALTRVDTDLVNGLDPRAGAVAAGILLQRSMELERHLGSAATLPTPDPDDEAALRSYVVALLLRAAKGGNPGALRKLTEAFGLADIVPGATINVKWVDPPEVIAARERQRAALKQDV